MALTTSREIYYDDHVAKLEHITGKTILSWRKCQDRFGSEVFFTDKTMIYLGYEEALPEDPNTIEYQRIPGTICVSCGEDTHAGTFDRHGRCSNVQRGYWKNVRKVYWHRYLKNR